MSITDYTKETLKKIRIWQIIEILSEKLHDMLKINDQIVSMKKLYEKEGRTM